MVSFKLAVFLGATTFVTCALAAPVPQGAANVALARRSGTSSDTSDLPDLASQEASDSDDLTRSSGLISHESTHTDLSSDDESPTSTLHGPVAPIRPVPVRLPAQPIQPIPLRLGPIRPVAVRLEPIQPQAERTRTQVNEAGPSRLRLNPPRPDSPRPNSPRPGSPRPNSPRPDSAGPSTRSSSRGNHVLETIPEHPPFLGAEDSGEDKGQ